MSDEQQKLLQEMMQSQSRPKEQFQRPMTSYVSQTQSKNRALEYENESKAKKKLLRPKTAKPKSESLIERGKAVDKKMKILEEIESFFEKGTKIDFCSKHNCNSKMQNVMWCSD
jgi:hypothetical protein